MQPQRPPPRRRRDDLELPGVAAEVLEGVLASSFDAPSPPRLLASPAGVVAAAGGCCGGADGEGGVATCGSEWSTGVLGGGKWSAQMLTRGGCGVIASATAGGGASGAGNAGLSVQVGLANAKESPAPPHSMLVKRHVPLSLDASPMPASAAPGMTAAPRGSEAGPSAARWPTGRSSAAAAA
eukprot:CAMPEP_0171226102 /NCGR_PEP_ID=MMETSP0790-20130122/37152_1 /TAXON_ID=2925 /ORGANISM="Alexandrium catenella, Strain OF101" /LENGTH=181 /DNA_ID=CAMNT_0011692161 /DNA_START=21 /DNA_END=563 /DNA_ORIENTATION=+